MRKILVTGGLGFIGSNLIKILLRQNFIVTNMFPLVIEILEEKNSFVMTFLISGIIGFGILFITVFLLAILLFTIKIILCKRNDL